MDGDCGGRAQSYLPLMLPGVPLAGDRFLGSP